MTALKKAMICCASCGELNPIKNNRCARCGESLASVAPRDVALFVAILLAACLAMAALWPTKSSQQVVTERLLANCNEAGAYEATQGTVTAALSPKPAKFPRDFVAKIMGGDCDWVVAARVDTVNSFNAPVRAYYRIRMTYIAERDEWRYRDLAFGDQAEIAKAVSAAR